MKIYALDRPYLAEYTTLLTTATADQRQIANDRYGSLVNEDSIAKPTTANKTVIIPITGILTDDPDPLGMLFGFSYTTYSSIYKAVASLDDSISNVVLAINSPGGSVEAGLERAYTAISTLAKTKRVDALNCGMCASAAYWLASASAAIYSDSILNEQGSIGVYASYVDQTEADKKAGIRIVQVRSSNAPLKNPSPDDPTLEAEIQKRLNDVESIFLAAVANGRKTTVENVANTFGKGGLVGVEQAISVGMLDGIKTIDEFIVANSNTALAENKPILHKGCQMSLKELLAEHPELSAELDELKKTAFDTGSKAERDRVACAVRLMGNVNYSEVVRSMATKVLAGSESAEKLEAFANYEEQLLALDASKKAQAKTEELPVTVAAEPVIKPIASVGSIQTEADLKALIGKK